MDFLMLYFNYKKKLDKTNQRIIIESEENI